MASTLASGVPVYCSHAEILPLGELRPRPNNPVRHPPKQIALYADVLKVNGWRRPVTISRRSGFIVRGHGARLAALKIGLTEVPVEYQDYESDAAELADLVADNRLPDLSQTDNTLLAQVLEEIGAAPVVTGYDRDFVKTLLATAAPEPQYPIVAKLNERHDYVVIVTDSETDFQFLKQLVGVRTERSFKNSLTGEGRVITLTRFLENLRANIDSIPPSRRDDDHASPAG